MKRIAAVLMVLALGGAPLSATAQQDPDEPPVAELYALVRQGRAQEAIEIARGNIVLWRAGQLNDGLGARWNYRLATSLIATQQYEAGLAAARLSDEKLARAGVLPASHTRWLARQEIVRGARRHPPAARHRRRPQGARCIAGRTPRADRATHQALVEVLVNRAGASTFRWRPHCTRLSEPR